MDVNRLLLVAGGLLVFSMLMIGGGIAMFRSQKEKETEQIREEKKRVAEIPAVKTQAVNAQAPPVHEKPSEGRLEILRVYRNPVDAELRIEVMGHPADHVAQMSPGQVSQLKKVVREIAAWIDMPVSEEMRQAAVESVDTGTPGPVQSNTPAASPPALNVPFADTLPPPREVKDLLPFRKKKKPELSEVPEPPKSIAAQIDELLQTMLPDTPLRGQDIRLSEDPSGGLKIIHGVKRYQVIDEVEDVEVRELIKKAVLVWNEQNRLTH